MKRYIPFLIIIFIVGFFFNPFFFRGKLPIPADTIVGLYHPFRDLYSAQYPRGIPFKNFQITDPVLQQYPLRKLSIDVMKRWELPLWNPYNFSGTPLMANMQSSPLYPLNLILFILPFATGWSVMIFLQPLLAMVFMYLFLRNTKTSVPASMLGALSFAFCGFFVSWMEWGNVVHTGLWLPLILLCIDKMLLRPDNSGNSKLKTQNSKVQVKTQKYYVWPLLFLVSITCSFLAGHLQVFYYLFTLSVAYFLFRWLEHGKDKQLLIVYVLLNLLFLLVTSPQWLVTFQFISYSARNLDQVSTAVPGWYIPWQNLTQFIAPDFFGNPSTLNYWGVFNYGEFISYIGIIPLLLALYAPFGKKEKMVWFFGIVFIVSIIFAFPTIFAKIPFKFSFPFISTSQPTRLLYLADLSLAVLAAFGFDAFLKKPRKVIIPLAIVGFFLLIFWSYVLFNSHFPTVLRQTSENLLVTRNNLKFPSVLYALSLLLLLSYTVLKNKFKYSKQFLIAGVLLISMLDLYRFTSKYETFADKKYLFPQTKIMSFLQKDKEIFRVMSTDASNLPPNFTIIYKVQTVEGYDPLFLKRYVELSAAVARNQPNISPPFGFNRIVTIENHDSQIINLLNVKYVLSGPELDPKRFKKIVTEGDMHLYENIQYFPRAFFVQKTFNAINDQDGINKIFEYQKDLRSVAIVQNEDSINKKNWDGEGQVLIERYQENDISVKTKNKREAFLVLSDSWYPTWHAFICDTIGKNCNETKIYLTNYNFRGVIVPGGEHTIIFQNRLL